LVPSYFDYHASPADRGFLAENQPGGIISTGTLMPTAGRQEMVRIKVPAAGLCTNIVLHVNTAGSSLTSGQCFAALYNAPGAQALIAQSVDQSTNWVGTGLKNAQLNGGPYYLHGGEYYVTFWYNGTTPPTIGRHSNVSTGMTNGLTAAPNLLWANNAGGLTTAAPATLPTQTATSITWWAALS
jgi:hypothetical protein